MSERDPYAREAQERWGDTDAYKESARRTNAYSDQDWEELQIEARAAVDLLLQAMKAGEPADSDEAMAGAEAHRLHIDKWFYPVSYDMHTMLAQMYISDERFKAHYEDISDGLAQYVHDAILANAISRV